MRRFVDQPHVITRTKHPIARMKGKKSMLSSSKTIKFSIPILNITKWELELDNVNLAEENEHDRRVGRRRVSEFLVGT